MKNRRTLISLLLVLVMLLALTACGEKTDTASSPAKESQGETSASEGGAEKETPAADGGESKLLDEFSVGNYGSAVFIGCFDPSFYFNVAGANGSFPLLYDQIFYQNVDTMESRIFSDWYYEDDTTLVLQLKDNIYFSNGDQMTPEDVLYSLDLFMRGSHGRNLSAIDFPACYAEGNTIYIKWSSVFAPGIKYMTCSVLNKDFVEGLIAEAGGDEMAIDWYTTDVVCGSGPYVCTDIATDSYAIYTLRDDYWGMEEYGALARTINCYYYSDQTTMTIEFEQGKLDICYVVSASDAERALAGEFTDGELGFSYNNGMIHYVFSDKADTFADKDLRLAFAHSLDTAAITEMSYGVYGVNTTGMFAEGMPYFVEGLCYDYDPDLSRELMAAAGKESVDFTLTVMNVAQFTAMAETTQYYAGQVGFNITLNILEAIAAIDEGIKGGQTIWLSNMSDGSTYEPHNMVSEYYNGMFPDIIRQDDTELQTHIVTGLTSVDDAVREAAYIWIQQYLYDNCIAVPLCDSADGYIYRTSVMDASPGCAAKNLTLINLK